MSDLFSKLQKTIDSLRPIDEETAMEVLNIDNVDFAMLLGYANKLRVKTQGDNISICAIMNAKSGSCSENCAFCAQSAHSEAQAEIYPMRDSKTIAKIHGEISRDTHCFGVVTSGEGLNDEDIDVLIKAIKEDKNGVEWGASLGIISDEQLLKLKNAGLTRYHHNIETAKSFYSQICTTHDWNLRADMAKRVKKVGLNLCCGVILGVGESKKQRVEAAMEINQIQSDTIPLNFLIAIKGTKLQDIPPMQPLDILKTVAMFRFVNPESDIKVAGGRVHLRQLQSMVFFAGASSMISGSLLTTPNCSTGSDRKLLADLELGLKNYDNI
ncbi:MAG: biotin synthase BioB [Chitinispirillales bacterium]|nr:biotin synthase BioB [Chitinispirillales bacterium]